MSEDIVERLRQLSRLMTAAKTKSKAGFDATCNEAADLIVALRSQQPSRERWNAGAEAMREACAKVIDEFNAQGSTLATTTVALMLVAQEVRVLPAPPEGGK